MRRCFIRPSAQDGNALFLILIAVALFAALGYAVTQSGRDGRSTDREQNTLDAARIVQYGSNIQAAVQRMVLTGTAISSIEFCTTGVDTCSAAVGYCETGTACVFAAEGGGISHESPPFTNGGINYSFYEAGHNVKIEDVGTTASELLMVLSSVPDDICEELNDRLGLSLPVPADANFFGLATQTLDDGYDGEPYQCVDLSTLTVNFYFHTLVER